jgi:hypothetical protein
MCGEGPGHEAGPDVNTCASFLTSEPGVSWAKRPWCLLGKTVTIRSAVCTPSQHIVDIQYVIALLQSFRTNSSK